MSALSESKTLDHELSLDLYAVILRIHAGATEDVVHAIAEGKVSLSKLKLLHILARPHSRPPRVRQVASLLELDPSPTSRLLNELDQERLVDRVEDEDDGRVRRVIITPAGRELLERLDRARIRQLEQFVRGLNTAERNLLRRALAELLKRPDVAALRPGD
jgi:DNA-binding MarR family transcriptional regulator